MEKQPEILYSYFNQTKNTHQIPKNQISVPVDTGRKLNVH